MTDITDKLKEDPVYVELQRIKMQYLSKLVSNYFRRGNCLSSGNQANARLIIDNTNYYQSLILNKKISKKDYNFLKDSSEEDVISRLRGD